MKNSHTPGPWRLNAGNETLIMGGNQRPIARAECGGTSGINLPEAEANARLIAEAPAMLEALRDGAEWLANGGEVDGVFFDEDSLLDRFREILARIDGEAGRAQAEGAAAEPTAICCTACGSTSVGCDAYARWDGSDWELSSTFDDTICDACGYESSSGFEEVKQSELREWRKARGFDADALAQED